MKLTGTLKFKDNEGHPCEVSVDAERDERSTPEAALELLEQRARETAPEGGEGWTWDDR